MGFSCRHRYLDYRNCDECRIYLLGVERASLTTCPVYVYFPISFQSGILILPSTYLQKQSCEWSFIDYVVS